MSELQQLATLAGIQLEFQDIWGKTHYASDAVIAGILEALGFPTHTPDATADSKARLCERHARALPFYKIIPAQRQSSFTSPGTDWELCDEQGNKTSGSSIRGRLILPPLPMGYYDLTVNCKDGVITTHLLVAPEQCWQPDAMRHQKKRLWGISSQLYSLRSEHHSGIGNFGDLQRLGAAAAAEGAEVIGVNPIHAMFPANPAHYSPYSPSSRLWLNTLYINTKHESAYPYADLIDYPSVSQFKQAVMTSDFQQQQHDAGFVIFRMQQGLPLEQQAIFDALSESFGSNWYHWPEEYRDPNAPAVAEFAANNADRVTYFAWAQWKADSQLEQVQRTVQQLGMSIGLYRDLAVGCDRSGAECWTGQQNFVSKLSVGVPPDEYNPNGQNWGLLPYNPLMLEEHGMSPFIALLRANMRHAGALRIDHAYGLSRMFLIPDGIAEGAYMAYPFDAYLAVLKIESHRHQCMVIGEDLGTAAPGYNQKASDAGVFSYKVLYFEKDENGFIEPDRYPAQSLATLSTHDLPPLTSWLALQDIEERHSLGLYHLPELGERERINRARDIPQLTHALALEGLEGTTHENVQRYLGRSAAGIVMVQLEDLLGLNAQVNLPGTVAERPNWRISLPYTLEHIIEAPLKQIAHVMQEERGLPMVTLPRATYRLQFHQGFTFYDAVNIIPYLAQLGISHVYASPYTQAHPMSMHGYDIIDHNSINPELGGEEGYNSFIATLHTHGLGHILDFVPNHMSVGNGNAWWQSVLEWGEASPCAAYFDIDWAPRYAEIERKLILPVLSEHYGDALEKGDLALGFDASTGGFYVAYFDFTFPICPRDYAMIDPEMHHASYLDFGQGLKDWLKHWETSAIEERLYRMNNDRSAMHALLERQHYRLTYWRVAASDINYRRFFDINELAGVRVEHPQVFLEMHKLVLSLIVNRSIDGLRIDHIDGLADPAHYCRSLRAAAGEKLYLSVEKILGSSETLPQDWQIQGTSGYEVLNDIAGLFIDPQSEDAFENIYRGFTNQHDSFKQQVYEAKMLVMETNLASEIQGLTLLLNRISNRDQYHRDYPFDTLKQAIKEIIGWFPVYRSYVTDTHISLQDSSAIDTAVRKAKRRSKFGELSIYDFIGALLRGEETDSTNELLEFIRRFQQLSGPVMAKGLEDTCFYRYNRLLCLNEVGGDPARFGLTIPAFHSIVKKRSESFPHNMIATATHDTKRGEDARMRISALSEMPIQWREWVMQWHKTNLAKRIIVEEDTVPTRNEEYFLYQTLLGSWPVEMLKHASGADLAAYNERLSAYLTKALREAKEQSSWAQPNEAYEAAMLQFAENILSPSHGFIEQFLPKVEQIAQLGACKSLSQLILKLTLPGVPDIYQGTEGWDFSLVDPDNRRPVDYGVRQERMGEVTALGDLLQQWQDGRIKQEIMRLLLTHRREHSALYTHGAYEAVTLQGSAQRHRVAFKRRYKDQSLWVIVPIHPLKLMEKDGRTWKEAEIAVPGVKQKKFRNILTDGRGSLNELAGEFPFLVLEPL